MTQQLIVDFEYDDTHLDLIETLNLMVMDNGAFYQILLPANRHHRWPLVKFTSWTLEQMEALIADLAMVHEDEDVAQARYRNKVTSY